jgi:hypothetical protein
VPASRHQRRMSSARDSILSCKWKQEMYHRACARTAIVARMQGGRGSAALCSHTQMTTLLEAWTSMLYGVNHGLCVVHLVEMILPSDTTSTIELCRALCISFATRMLWIPARRHRNLQDVSSEMVKKLPEEVRQLTPQQQPPSPQFPSRAYHLKSGTQPKHSSQQRQRVQKQQPKQSSAFSPLSSASPPSSATLHWCPTLGWRTWSSKTLLAQQHISRLTIGPHDSLGHMDFRERGCGSYGKSSRKHAR